MKAPELLAPAGTLRNMRYAFAYGADAVYAGQPRYSLRVRNNDFDQANLAIGIAEAHAQGRKFYVASNIFPRNSKVDTYLRDMEAVIALKPDALIMADPGLIMLVRERWPEMAVHLSVQANTVNYAAVKFWQALGLTRVILSRELSLGEIADIRQRCPDMELEVFVHGALCIAYSGRCLLSGYFNHRDPNQGTCTNACRWEYGVTPAQEAANGDIERLDFNAFAALKAPPGEREQRRHPLADRVYLIEERQRPGEWLPIMEDEHGTYIMNSKDLRAIEHVQKLVEIGVDSLKIEGRTKSHYYVARVSQAYRQAIDDALAGRPFDARLLPVLEGLANRGYTDGFLQRHHDQDHQNYLRGSSQSERQQFVGEIVAVQGGVGEIVAVQGGVAEIETKNRFGRGDTVELITPAGNHRWRLDTITTTDGDSIDCVPGGGHRVHIPLPANALPDYALLAKDL